MRRPIATLLLCGLLAVPGARADQAAGLGERLAGALQSPALRGAQVSALVVRGRDGAVLFARAPGRALVPASNQKVLTALAALATFGPAHRFTTSVYADAAPDAEGAVATLYVRGGGDPALTSEDWWRLAADLRRSGLARVRGDLVIDDAAFDAERWHPAWGAVGARAYHAPVGALAANYGAFAVEVAPGPAAEQPARVALDPPIPFLRLANRASTGLPGGRLQLQVGRSALAGGDRVLVSGVLPADAPSRTFYRSVSDPGLYAGGVLRWQLAANGVAVGGRVRRGAPPPEAPELLAFEGRPLAEVVRLFLKYSNNMIAEALVKAMGSNAGSQPGSWANGMAALRARLAALGLDLGESRLVDGSGLARGNRVSPRLLVEALRLAGSSFDFGPEFLAGLPIAAADGTLEKRAGDAAGAVRAKTGLLDHVTALSGYARIEGGGQAVFSILVNGHRASDEEAMDAVDGFLRALVRGAPPTLVQESLGPRAPRAE